MLLSGLVMFFNTSLIEIFTRLTDYVGVIFGVAAATFSDLLSMADVFARPMLNLIGYLGAFVVVAGAMYSAIGHRLWGRWRKRER